MILTWFVISWSKKVLSHTEASPEWRTDAFNTRLPSTRFRVNIPSAEDRHLRIPTWLSLPNSIFNAFANAMMPKSGHCSVLLWQPHTFKRSCTIKCSLMSRNKVPIYTVFTFHTNYWSFVKHHLLSVCAIQYCEAVRGQKACKCRTKRMRLMKRNDPARIAMRKRCLVHPGCPGFLWTMKQELNCCDGWSELWRINASCKRWTDHTTL